MERRPMAVLATLVIVTLQIRTSAQTPPPSGPATSVNSHFTTRILSGGSPNGLEVDAQRTTFRTLPEAAVTWVKDSGSSWFTRPAVCKMGAQSPPAQVLSKAAAQGNESKTILSVQVPNPPCWWPRFQDAPIAIGSDLAKKGGFSV